MRWACTRSVVGVPQRQLMTLHILRAFGADPVEQPGGCGLPSGPSVALRISHQVRPCGPGARRRRKAAAGERARAGGQRACGRCRRHFRAGRVGRVHAGGAAAPPARALQARPHPTLSAHIRACAVRRACPCAGGVGCGRFGGAATPAHIRTSAPVCCEVRPSLGRQCQPMHLRKTSCATHMCAQQARCLSISIQGSLKGLHSTRPFLGRWCQYTSVLHLSLAFVDRSMIEEVVNARMVWQAVGGARLWTGGKPDSGRARGSRDRCQVRRLHSTAGAFQSQAPGWSDF